MNWKKRLLPALMVILAIITTVGAYLYFALWIPNRRMMNPGWWDSTPQEEIRKNCHTVLRHQIGNHHDAFLWLAENGNKESVPLLISSLKWQPKPSKSGLMVCTTGHCLDALKSLTGHYAGSSYEEWNEWWKTIGSKLPSKDIYPHLEIKEANQPE